MAEEFQVDDLSDVVDELATGIYVVTRPAPSVFINGRRQNPSSTVFEVRAAVFPASGRQLERLPEGLRTSEVLRVITKTELKTASSGGEPDRITVRGIDYQVHQVQSWQPSGKFFEALVTKVPS